MSERPTNFTTRWQDNEIPDGFQIYENQEMVAGVKYRKAAATKFVKAEKAWLELEPEPSNQHDKNAIKIIGCYKGFFGIGKLHIGYVQAAVASKLVRSGYLEKVKARLTKTYLSPSGFVDVYYQILGPKGEKKGYKSFK